MAYILGRVDTDCEIMRLLVKTLLPDRISSRVSYSHMQCYKLKVTADMCLINLKEAFFD